MIEEGLRDAGTQSEVDAKQLDSGGVWQGEHWQVESGGNQGKSEDHTCR